jgi:hypothetical protein
MAEEADASALALAAASLARDADAAGFGTGALEVAALAHPAVRAMAASAIKADGRIMVIPLSRAPLWRALPLR